MDMKEFISIAAALSDPSRARIVMALSGRELCVCQIVELLKLAPSTVSKHLSILHQTGLAESRKDSRWVYYRLPGRGADLRIKEAVKWAKGSLADSPQIKEDALRLKKILKRNPEELCRTQGAR